MMEKSDSGEEKVFRIPRIKTFENTGFVEHKFADDTMIHVSVVPSEEYDTGADIRLVMDDSDGSTICDMTMTKFAALCLANAIIKNLVNQEEIEYDIQQRVIKSNNS